MAKPIRDSSAREYQNKWKLFLEYLDQNNIILEECTLSNVVNFFVMLYKDKKVKAGTVAHYRSALSVPLRICLNIDILSEAVSAMIKGMAINRPSNPTLPPKWDLNKVLIYIDNLPRHLSLKDYLARAAFLLLLATGWSIFMLQACIRLSTYCSISSDNVHTI